MSRMDLIKTKKVPCLHVSRCWISFLKCQHNLEGAEKKEARKKHTKKTHTHTHTRCGLWEKKDNFSVTQYSILFFGLQTKFTILEQQITIIIVISCFNKVNLVWRPKKWYWKSSLLLIFSLSRRDINFCREIKTNWWHRFLFYLYIHQLMLCTSQSETERLAKLKSCNAVKWILDRKQKCPLYKLYCLADGKN